MAVTQIITTPQRRVTANNRMPLIAEAPTAPQPREFRRVIGYHNALAEDAPLDEKTGLTPPSYDIAVFRPARSGPGSSRRAEEGREILPDYSCSVSIEGPLGMKLEQAHPFDTSDRPQWSEVYMSLTGPMLSVYQVRKPNSVLGKAAKPAPAPGRLLKAYTLQHAELGIAADHPKIEMVPKSAFVHMLPEGTIERLQENEPQLFESVRRYVIRLRLEADQVLLRFTSSEERSRWLEKLCAAVDIAQPLDERTEPKYHTLPRRRRRNNAGLRAAMAQAIAASLADQGTLTRTQTNDAPGSPMVGNDDNALVPTTTIDPDSGDIDTSLAMTDLAEPVSDERPSHLPSLFRLFSNSSNHQPPSVAPSVPNSTAPAPAEQGAATTTTVARIPARIYPDDYTKWQPQFLIDPAQQVRYRRHCMPNLLYTSKRANDIIIKDGLRWLIDWEKETLRPYPEQPPTYKKSEGEEDEEDAVAGEQEGRPSMSSRRSMERRSMDRRSLDRRSLDLPGNPLGASPWTNQEPQPSRRKTVLQRLTNSRPASMMIQISAAAFPNLEGPDYTPRRSLNLPRPDEQPAVTTPISAPPRTTVPRPTTTVIPTSPTPSPRNRPTSMLVPQTATIPEQPDAEEITAANIPIPVPEPKKKPTFGQKLTALLRRRKQQQEPKSQISQPVPGGSSNLSHAQQPQLRPAAPTNTSRQSFDLNDSPTRRTMGFTRQSLDIPRSGGAYNVNSGRASFEAIRSPRASFEAFRQRRSSNNKSDSALLQGAGFTTENSVATPPRTSQPQMQTSTPTTPTNPVASAPINTPTPSPTPSPARRWTSRLKPFGSSNESPNSKRRSMITILSSHDEQPRTPLTATITVPNSSIPTRHPHTTEESTTTTSSSDRERPESGSGSGDGDGGSIEEDVVLEGDAEAEADAERELREEVERKVRAGMVGVGAQHIQRHHEVGDQGLHGGNGVGLGVRMVY